MLSFKNLSIRNKLILIQGVTALIAVLTCCTIFVNNDINIYKESSYTNKYSIAEIIGENSISALLFQDKDAATKILTNLRGNASILNAEILDRNGNEFAQYSKSREEAYIFPQQESFYKEKTFSENEYFIRYHIIQNNELLGTVIIRAELTNLTKIIFTYLKAAVLVLIIGLSVALVISFFLQQAISTRLLSLVSNIKEVSATGNYSIRASKNGKDEIAVLAVGFNGMMEQIEGMEKTLREANLSLEARVKERTIELEIANKEMESFSYSVSHDMRAPLRTINGYSKIIEKKYAHLFDNDGKEVLQTINEEASRMGKLIDDLLSFSRLGRQEVQKTKIDMNTLASQVLAELMRSEENAKTATINVDALPPAYGDTVLIQQVLFNLLSNAIKYSSRKKEPLIHFGSYKEEGKVIYFIRDNGAGFEMKYYNKLFGVFQRLHSQDEFKGTGIGLAIVQKIILRHGGSVWAESDPKIGTTFYFSLPSL